MKEEELQLELPTDEDENIGDIPKKRTKRKKSKEERMADRRVVFWTLILVCVITLIFWLVPLMKTANWKIPSWQMKSGVNEPQKKSGSYIEYKL